VINIACVLKTYKSSRRGSRKCNSCGNSSYTIDWVDKLYNGVKRNLSTPFNFVCFSNEQTLYNTIRLKNNFDGFWNKIEIFRSGIFDGPVLYFDLDVIICQDITKQINELPINQFLMVKEPYRNIINSSVMYFNGDYSYLYDDYVTNEHSTNNEYKNAGLRYGDQAYISENVKPETLETYTSDNFIGWKHHKVNTKFDDCSILIFTSTEKPNNNIDLDIVKNNWY